MTKREIMRERAQKALASYIDYVNSIDVHQKPTAGVNSGAEGRAFERSINFDFGLYERSYFVQGNNKMDSVKYLTDEDGKRRTNIEIKSGCGTLAIIDEEKNIVSSPLFKSHYVVYTPRFYPNVPAKDQCFIIETQTFLSILKECGLIREKRSGLMQKRKNNGEHYYNDVLAIQSFENSKRKKNAFLSALTYEGMLFDDFIEWYDITIV